MLTSYTEQKGKLVIIVITESDYKVVVQQWMTFTVSTDYDKVNYLFFINDTKYKAIAKDQAGRSMKEALKS